MDIDLDPAVFAGLETQQASFTCARNTGQLRLENKAASFFVVVFVLRV